MSPEYRQTYLPQAGRSKVTRDEIRVSLVHEKSQRGKLEKAGSSPTAIIVPQGKDFCVLDAKFLSFISSIIFSRNTPIRNPPWI
jgi:hypothetical protein